MQKVVRAAIPGFIVSAVLGLSALAGADATRPCTRSELSQLRIWDSVQAKHELIGEKVRFLWNLRVRNGTDLELAEVDVRLVGDTGGVRSFTSPPVPLRIFQNSSLPSQGSLLPQNKSEFVLNIPYEVPARLWTTEYRMYVEIVGASTFSAPIDLHDPGHLYAFLHHSNPRQSIAVLQKDPSLLRVRNRFNFTPLLMAFATSSPVVIEYIASHGGKYADQTTGGSTIMHLAAVNEHAGVLQLALKHGGQVNQLTKSADTPLAKSIVYGAPSAWRWLLSHGADPTLDARRRGFSPVHAAIHEGNTKALHDLIRAGANPKAHDAQGNGWLHYAVWNNLLINEIAKLGVPVNDVNPLNGMTPLMMAAQIGDANTLTPLLKLGANPNLRDKAGRNSYDYAVMSNTLRTDRFLRALVARYGKKK